MAGTKAGAAKAVATSRERYGGRFYQEIGRKGGRSGHSGGFASNPLLAKEAGRKGGRLSKRGVENRVTTILEPHADEIQEMYDSGLSMLTIAEKLSVPVTTLRKWANESIDGYGMEWSEKE